MVDRQNLNEAYNQGFLDAMREVSTRNTEGERVVHLTRNKYFELAELEEALKQGKQIGIWNYSPPIREKRNPRKLSVL